MTEQEWLVCSDPQQMLDFLRDNATERKFILVVCACGHLVRHLLTDPRSKGVLPIVERFADGLASQKEIDAVFQPACDAAGEAAKYAAGKTDGPPLPTWAAAWVVAKAVIATSTMRGEDAFFGAVDGVYFATAATGEPPVRILQDIFGNPFRRVTLKPAWRTSSVTSLAHGIYDERRFADLPILADALEDAGCTHKKLLSHCRGPGPHVRGCWVVDLLLGKE